MDRQRFDTDARKLLGDALRRDVPLAPLTTLRVGGPADWLAGPRSMAELESLLAAARASGIPVTVLGGGSNVVVADTGVRGLVVRLALSGIEQPDSGSVRAEAGVTINGLVRWTIGRGLAGLERWAGTPGTVGGAIHGNAHWQGRNAGELVRQVGLLSPDGEARVVPRASMGFGYDTSRLQGSGEILLWAEFEVTPGDPSALRLRARESLAYRKGTQPLAMPSAGCVFQNPDPSRDTLPAGVPASAGALVDLAGLKGHRAGGAAISTTHANFIVNEGGATAAEVRSLAELARRTVADRFGVMLRDEVVWMGAF